MISTRYFRCSSTMKSVSFHISSGVHSCHTVFCDKAFCNPQPTYLSMLLTAQPCPQAPPQPKQPGEETTHSIALTPAPSPAQGAWGRDYSQHSLDPSPLPGPRSQGKRLLTATHVSVNPGLLLLLTHHLHNTIPEKPPSSNNF